MQCEGLLQQVVMRMTTFWDVHYKSNIARTESLVNCILLHVLPLTTDHDRAFHQMSLSELQIKHQIVSVVFEKRNFIQHFETKTPFVCIFLKINCL